MKDLQERIKILQIEDNDLAKQNEQIVLQGQQLQQRLNENNLKRLKTQGAIEVLESMLSDE
jgi:hypothetical protein